MTVDDLAGIIHDRLVDSHGQTEPFGDGTSIVDVSLVRGAGFGHVLVTASDGSVYRVMVEEWP